MQTFGLVVRQTFQDIRQRLWPRECKALRRGDPKAAHFPGYSIVLGVFGHRFNPLPFREFHDGFHRRLRAAVGQ
jgi:hypothetical protein